MHKNQKLWLEDQKTEVLSPWIRRHRRIASEGGHASHGRLGRDYEDEYEQNYDEDEGQRVGNRGRDEGYGNEDEYEDTGYGEDEDEYENDEHDKRGRRSSSRGRRYLARRGNSSRRGFGSVDPEQRRRIARTGGQAKARSHGHEYYEDVGRSGETVRDEYGPEFYEDNGRRGGQRVRAEYGPEFYSQIGRKGGGAVSEGYGPEFYEDIDRRGGRARWEEEDEDEYGRYRSPGRSSSSFNRRSTRSGRRGFAAVPREEVRRIARMGGRAKWEDDDRGRSRSSRGQGRGR